MPCVLNIIFVAKDERVTAAMEDTFGSQDSAASQRQQRVAEFREAVAKENTAQQGGSVRYNVRQNLVDVNGKVYAKVIKPGHTDYNRTKHSNKTYKTTLYNKIFQRKTTIYNVDGSKMVVEFAGAKERVNNHPVLGEFTETADRLKRIALFNHQELLKNSVEDTPNSPDGHKWVDEQGWKRRRSYMLDLDKIYPVYFHISTTEDGRNLLYDITVDKNEGVDLDPKPISHDDQTVRATADRDSPQLAVKDLTPSGDKVSQGTEVVKHQNSDRMNPNVDSKGRSLSVQQQEYFRESVVVDSEGRLLTMYHGTSRGGFTVFDVYGSNHGLFGMGLYFTDNPDVAQSYTKKGKGTSPQVYEVYLNIKRPMDMDAPADPEAWAKAVPDADFPESGTNEDFYRAMEQYLEDEMYTRWEGAEYAMETISQMGYDGVTHIGGGRVNADGVRHRVYIAFEQEQVKEVSNKQPTDDYDIYRQDRMQQTASGREAFAQVLDSVATDGADRLTIQRYRDAAKAMDEQERKLNEINAQIREITYGTGEQDSTKLRELRLEASKARNRAKLYEDQLTKLEHSQPYQKMMGEIKKTGAGTVTNAVGAAAAGFDTLSSMEYEYGNLPEGENAVRDDTLPKSTNGQDIVMK